MMWVTVGIVGWVVIGLCLLTFVGSSSSPRSDFLSAVNDPLAPWNQPVVPSLARQKTFRSPTPTNPDIYLPPNSTNISSKEEKRQKRVPKHCWIAFYQQPTNLTMKGHTRKMFERNYPLGWNFHFAGNAEKLAFMRQYFANTSTLWAYENIHKRVGNSAADIWRYAVLYLFGGLYLDDDSYFEAKFDDVIGKNDSLIVSTEKNAFRDECYHEDFHLSSLKMKKSYPKGDPGIIHGGRVIVSWGIFAQPQHPIVYRTLENIVEMIRFEFIRQSPLILHLRNHAKWMICMCVTGPHIFTASQREMLLHYGDEMSREIVVHKRDFHQFGGVFKVYEGDKKNIENHYMHTMQLYNIPLLASYFNETSSNSSSGGGANGASTTSMEVSDYNGKIVSSDGRELFYVMHNERRGFQDWDAFTSLHMLHHPLIRLSAEDLKRIPMSSLAAFTTHDADLVKEYQHKLQKQAHKRQRQHAEYFVEDETFHYHWPASWPTLQESFLSQLESTWTTLNVSTVEEVVPKEGLSTTSTG